MAVKLNLANPFSNTFAELSVRLKDVVEEDIKTDNYLRATNKLGTEFYQVPLTLRTSDGKSLKLPVDPLVSVSSKYNIAKRNVQKQGTMRGTIKEYWNQGDLSISIGGILIADSSEQLGEYVRLLREICDKPEAVEVECEMLNQDFQVLKIVVESVDFPFTKGVCNQSFTIKALSDESYELLV